MTSRYLHISQEVRQALANKRPVVALESTIIAHGMPYPQNFETATEVEQILRKSDVTPATIAVMGGKMRVGLGPDEIEKLAGPQSGAVKTSVRDIACVLADGGLGATTVAATVQIAAMAGIRVMATGGIGGVHRGVQETLDVSADLNAIAANPVAVISSGAKAILDLPRTMEYLETEGVPVLGYRTDEFPAFFTAKSGLELTSRVESADEVAEIMRAQWALGLKQGILVANPIPEAFELKYREAQRAIEQALTEADQRSTRGKEITPFLLRRIAEITDGRSLKANVALVKDNAQLAAEVAVAWWRFNSV